MIASEIRWNRRLRVFHSELPSAPLARFAAPLPLLVAAADVGLLISSSMCDFAAAMESPASSPSDVKVESTYSSCSTVEECAS